MDPIWPLPRKAGSLGDQEAEQAFAQFDRRYYAFEFEGGVRVSTVHDDPGHFTNPAERPLQRFRHFMPWLLAKTGGDLRGKRVLDIACNAGFWSLQCALLGAEEVVSFDANPHAIEQARLAQAITGVKNIHYRVMPFEEASNSTLGGPFDVVLNLGFLYHVTRPLEVIERTLELCKGHLVLDTAVQRGRQPNVQLVWERQYDRFVTRPTRAAIEMMMRQAGAAEWFEIPIRTTELPIAYLSGRRASWLVRR